MKNGGVYLIENTANGRVYVGSSKDVDRRLEHHTYQLSRGKHHNSRLQKDYTSQQGVGFEYKVIEHSVPTERLQHAENYWIKGLCLVGEDYNIKMTSGNTPQTTGRRDPETEVLHKDFLEVSLHAVLSGGISVEDAIKIAQKRLRLSDGWVKEWRNNRCNSIRVVVEAAAESGKMDKLLPRKGYDYEDFSEATSVSQLLKRVNHWCSMVEELEYLRRFHADVLRKLKEEE